MTLTIQEVMKNHEKAFRPEKAEGVDVVIQFNFTGEQASDWIVTLGDGKCVVKEGVAETPNMTLSTDAQDYIGIVTGQADPMKLFMAGKVKLKGDLNQAMKLTTYFKMG